MDYDECTRFHFIPLIDPSQSPTKDVFKQKRLEIQPEFFYNRMYTSTFYYAYDATNRPDSPLSSRMK